MNFAKSDPLYCSTNTLNCTLDYLTDDKCLTRSVSFSTIKDILAGNMRYINVFVLNKICGPSAIDRESWKARSKMPLIYAKKALGVKARN